MRSAAPILTLRGIGKRFGGVIALADVDLDVFPGEVQAILGENGAGKSTLMRVIYGLVAPDAGVMCLDGTAVQFASPLDARRGGIGMVHQEFALVDALSVAENLALSVGANAGVMLDRDAVAARARQIAGDVGLDLGDLDAPVGALPVGVRQRVEIIKALAGRPRLLILDEPTAVLTPQEVEQLFDVLARLRQAGTSVLFITHKLGEIMAIADRVMVMRGSRVVARVERAQLSEADLAAQMIGAAAPARTTAPQPTAALVQLELRHIRTAASPGATLLDDVSLTARAGEIFGIAGVDGNGQAELFDLLAGIRAPTGGAVVVGGTTIERFTPAAMGEAGIACVPPDRLRQGVVGAMSVAENAVLNERLLRRVSHNGLLPPVAVNATAEKMVEAFAIKVASLDDPVRALSGGNMQKLVVARALAQQPRVLVVANPTRGLDIAAAAAVHAAFLAALNDGAAIILISVDLDEIVALAHRVAVLYRGRLSQPLEQPVPIARLGALMAGGREAALH